MILREIDSGRTIDMNLGGVVTVRLKENPTTGYRWSEETTDGLEKTDDHNETSGAIGAEGIRVFEFHATRVGSYELRLEKKRRWEGEGSIIDRFSAKVIVK